MLDRLGQLILPRPWLVLTLAALSLIPCVYLASQLEFESSFTALLPEEYPAVRDLNAGIAQTGGSAFAVVAIPARDRALAERFADRLARELPALSAVRYVQARLDVEFIRERQLLYLTAEQLAEATDELAAEIDQRTVGEAGLGLDLEDSGPKDRRSFDLDQRFAEEAAQLKLSLDPYLVGKDGEYLYVFVALKGDAGDLGTARRTQSELEERCLSLRGQDGFPPDLALRFSGSQVIRLEEDAIMQGDLKTAGLVGFWGVVGLLVLYTRRARTLALLALPLIVGMAATFAFAELAIGRLNIISGFLASILSGLGIEFGIHLLLRYREERARGQAIEVAQRDSWRTTGRSLVGSALTNAGAFGVVSFAGFQGFSEFGVIAGVGMLLTLAATLLVFPAINLVLERFRPMKLPAPPSGAEEGLFVPRWLKVLVLAGVPLLAGYSALALATGQVRFRTNWREIKGESPASDFDDYIIDSLGGSFTQSLVLAADLPELGRVKDVVARVQDARRARGQPTGITGSLSLADLVPPDQEARLAAVKELEKQLRRIKPERLNTDERRQLAQALRLVAVRPFTAHELPRSLAQRFETTSGGGSLLMLRTNYLFYESAEIVAWAEEMSELRGALDAAGLHTPIISENWIAGTVFQIIIGDGPFILGATFLVVFLVLLADFRSPRRALLVLAALALGQLSIAGGMVLTGQELNFINAAVLPIIVGVSIDNAMHIYHRYLEEGPDSIPKVLRYTASATTLSSATNLMGFGAMIVAHHKGLRSVAELAILGIFLTFVSTSVFFPLALELLGRRGRGAQPASIAEPTR